MIYLSIHEILIEIIFYYTISNIYIYYSLHLLFNIYSQYYFTNKILKLRERRVISLNNQIFLIDQSISLIK